MAKLSGPYEIFDIGDGEAVQVRVLRYEEGEVEIHPGYGREVKTVVALRIHLATAWIERRLPYIDITSGRLKAQLLPFLKELPPGGKVIKITKYGTAPTATFSVESL